jgi:hypothetical protein
MKAQAIKKQKSESNSEANLTQRRQKLTAMTAKSTATTANSTETTATRPLQT